MGFERNPLDRSSAACREGNNPKAVMNKGDQDVITTQRFSVTRLKMGVILVVIAILVALITVYMLWRANLLPPL